LINIFKELKRLMSRFTDLFSSTDVVQEPVVQEVVVEEVKIQEVVEEPKVVELLPPKPIQNLSKPSLRRTHK
jgi:hypothetical protein